jgi:hypothetical protein
MSEVVEPVVDEVVTQIVETEQSESATEILDDVSGIEGELTEEEVALQAETTAEESEETIDQEADNLLIEGLKYGDVEVNAEIPQEVNDLLKEKGFSAQELTKELYEGGEISLPQETLDQLYEAYGKFQVDSYMDGLKSHAALMEYTSKEQAEGLETANTEAWNSALETVGTEENWTAMETWLQSEEGSTISDDKIAQFNEVMENGSPYMKDLAIKSMYAEFTSTLPEDAPELQLIEGTPIQSAGGKDYLTAQEFFDIQVSGDYSKATASERQSWDDQRQKGISKGY